MSALNASHPPDVRARLAELNRQWCAGMRPQWEAEWREGQRIRQATAALADRILDTAEKQKHIHGYQAWEIITGQKMTDDDAYRFDPMTAYHHPAMKLCMETGRLRVHVTTIAEPEMWWSFERPLDTGPRV